VFPNVGFREGEALAERPAVDKRQGPGSLEPRRPESIPSYSVERAFLPRRHIFFAARQPRNPRRAGCVLPSIIRAEGRNAKTREKSWMKLRLCAY
jgi:hypothetical protein